MSSINEVKKKSINILGKKTTILPRPLMIPSVRRSLNIPDGIVCLIKPETNVTPSPIQFIGNPPKLNVAKKVKNIKNRKIGKPKYLWVISWSIFPVMAYRHRIPGTKVSRRAPEIKPYLASVIKFELSLFNLDLSREISFFTVSIILSKFDEVSIIFIAS